MLAGDRPETSLETTAVACPEGVMLTALLAVLFANRLVCGLSPLLTAIRQLLLQIDHAARDFRHQLNALRSLV